jgi:cyclic 2,3-diphosphoglycerate synthetase
MSRRAVALIDGEHYPAVVVDALRQAFDRFEFLAALFLGGTEKIKAGDLAGEAEKIFGLPVIFDRDQCRGLARIIEEYRPEVVVDLSDEPVLGYEQRFRLISEALARGVGYEGPDFHFSPTSSARLCASPSLSIIGTGKRVGKTAVSGYVARVLQGVVTGRVGGPAVVVVAMGRGGPARPEVIDGAGIGLTVRDLLAWSRQGRHAASDHFEDALLSRVTTVGCRRCGGGMAGEPFSSNVAEGVALANGLGPGLIVLEGSGAAQPPVGSDVRLLVAGAHQPIGSVAGYLGTYRLLVSDAVVLTMAVLHDGAGGAAGVAALVSGGAVGLYGGAPLRALGRPERAPGRLCEPGDVSGGGGADGDKGGCHRRGGGRERGPWSAGGGGGQRARGGRSGASGAFGRIDGGVGGHGA